MLDPSIRLFSYGTLRQPQMQHANYGRLIDGEAMHYSDTSYHHCR